jgi:hypothetical protein
MTAGDRKTGPSRTTVDDKEDRRMNSKSMIAGLVAAASLLPSAWADTRASVGAEYSEGKYGASDTTSEWRIPFSLDYQYQALTLGLSVPYVSTKGTVNSQVGGLGQSETSGKGQGQNQGQGGGSLRTVSQSQSGLGDTVISAFLDLSPPSSEFGLDAGVKAKLVTASRDNDLITTGNPDYSLQVDAYGNLAQARVIGSLGWTLKGDIRVRDDAGTFYTENPNNPWYASIGLTYPAKGATRVGISYDWRQALFSDADAASEATLFLQHRSGNWRVNGYTFAGFSNASPDWGIGIGLSRYW